MWPKYVALNPRLLDKLELVLAKIGSRAKLSEAVGDGAEPHRARVVAERVPQLADLAGGRVGQGLQRWVGADELPVLGEHAAHLRLLQHDL